MARRLPPDGLIPATLRGGSMRPWLAPGTEVLVRPVRAARGCRAGDVLVFRLGDAWAAHRATRSSAGPALPPTRGDWTGRADPRAETGAWLGRIVRARIGGRWRRVDGPAARLAGLATGAAASLLDRIGARGLLSELRRSVARRARGAAAARQQRAGRRGSRNPP